ncbi:hypothetical protein SADUNF_Sadunf01G0125100 [Salix dunnii]|uniref:non-specific serine/threonine protein kinase n=1 Tax=Salix dunnii TaxID=1413687 RepID=A0A835NBH4_9ROSI|nr:hypothetical protein SADUNF_Sadunf01G0125100 [Salix dunnii]
MQTQFSNTQLALIDSLTTTTTESDLQEKAWHILALLLSIGNATPAPDLAPHCTLFNASPDLIESLCSIPDSPIALKSNHDNSNDSFLVTISPLGLYALNQFLSNFNMIDAFASRICYAICDLEVPLEDLVRMYFRKRKRIGFDSADVYDKDQEVCPLPKRIRNDCWKLPFHLTGVVSSSINVEPSYMLIQPNNFIPAPNFFVKTLVSELGCKLRSTEHVDDEMNTRTIVESKEDKRMMACELDEDSALPIIMLDNEAVFQEAKVDEVDLESRIDINATCCLADVKWNKTLSLESTGINGACNGTNDCHIETVKTETEDEPLIDYGKMEGDGEGINQFQSQSTNTTFNMPEEGNFRRMNELSYLDKESIKSHVKNQANISTTELCVPPKKLKDSNPSTKIRVTTGVAASSRQQALCHSLEQKKAATPPKENQRRKKDHMKISMGQKSKQTCNDTHTKERKKDRALNSPKDRVGSKDFPCFDSYIVEEEEGSGGYGTVYRATRKHGGTTVAIKCPHENAHRHHVSNELRMLERFGGKNFVIKFEGCLKNLNSDCFVLEYVEHDRPEVLKKEIDVFQLRWYGYCMFRALASLHKQGVVHRDIKPGNFLFSCKANKGYLIDFNLSLDLHQKLGTIIDMGTIKGFKSTLEAKNVKRKAVGNIMKSQGADGSGITSVKDATSARTPSAERLKEPLPSQASMRKRIAAPGKVDGRHIYVTPMPLHSTGITVAGIGLVKNKCDGKNKKEGPCVGTKGFRAPEVLFRSLHQGPKVDIWSAGVTLLYLIIGKTPFYGDPEQNIKDIAKLRGSEDLWEVSKLHNRESSFPVDLYNMQSLPPTTLWEWCKLNSKRQDFLDAIPGSLIDLVDKCLTVNPRLRISAEDALKHQFFAPCTESLRRQKLLRQGNGLDSQTNTLSHGQTIARPIKISQRQP